MNKLISKLVKFLVITTLLIIIGCTPNIYNTPYIDTTETVQIKNNLSKNEVINILGEPLYVEQGTQTNGEISWIYEVRAREVMSDLLTTGEISPNKDHVDKRPSQPIHHLKVIFINGKIAKWEILDQEKKQIKEGVDSTKKIKKKKPKKFFFYAKAGFDKLNYETEDFKEGNWSYEISEESATILVLGAYLGLESPKYRFGLDAKLIGQQGIFVTYEKRNLFSSQYNFIMGGGGYRYKPKEEKEVITLAKIGVSRDIMLSGKQTNIGMDLLFSEDGISPVIYLAYKLK